MLITSRMSICRGRDMGPTEVTQKAWLAYVGELKVPLKVWAIGNGI